ncbi:hypothetical protein [Aliiroseovarius sp.]|uniref:hypothetical protein n=1 Tax=Aliiroseovarius sp. TaxID=1872442 RepID=UPI003BAAD982
MNPDDHTFFRGAALSSDRFVAVAFVDALERPSEPSSRMILTEFDAASGIWASHQQDDLQINALERFFTPEGIQGRALSEEGAIIDTGSGEQVGQTNAQGTMFAGLASNATNIVAAGHGGYYYRSQSGRDFGLITSDPIYERPKFGADPEAFSDYYESQTIVFEVAMNDSWLLAIASDQEGQTLSSRGNLETYPNARIVVGVTWDNATNAFWFCGHSPDAQVFRLDPPMGIKRVFHAQSERPVFASVAIVRGPIWVGEYGMNDGGVWAAPVSAPEALRPIDLPQNYPASPVWKIATHEDALWVLRSKDLLRLQKDTRERFVPPNG